MTNAELKKIKKVFFKTKTDLVVGKNVSVVKTDKQNTLLKLPTKMLGFVFMINSNKFLPKVKIAKQKELGPSGYEYDDEIGPKELERIAKLIKKSRSEKSYSMEETLKRYGLRR